MKLYKGVNLRADNLKPEILFECIIRGSAIVQKYSGQQFYTFNGKPKDWIKSMLADFRKSEHYKYKGRDFYVVFSSTREVIFIFWEGSVYSYDHAFNGCPILAEILEEYISA